MNKLLPQIAPEAIEAAISQQIGEILKEIMPALEPAQKPDPLVDIRQKELENDTAEIQRKAINDLMNFQIDQAKLQQAFDLAQQRKETQEQIAEDRNDVNIYRINTQGFSERKVMLDPASIGVAITAANTAFNAIKKRICRRS